VAAARPGLCGAVRPQKVQKFIEKLPFEWPWRQSKQIIIAFYE
jgi:hypothetical protein